MLAGLILLGCEEKPKEPQASKVVSKKIAAQKTAKKSPIKKVAKKSKAKPASKAVSKKSNDKAKIAQSKSNKNVKTAQATSPQGQSDKTPIATTEKTDLNLPQPNREKPAALLPALPAMDEKAVVAAKSKPSATGSPDDELKLLARAGFYNPKGKIDPFKPLIRDKGVTKSSKKQKRRKRVPLTPLEKIELSQLTLVGVVQASSGNRAIVQEASGKGYIITEGTFIGTNAGQVEKILPDSVIVEEEVENVTGYIETRRRELRLKKPFGE